MSGKTLIARLRAITRSDAIRASDQLSKEEWRKIRIQRSELKRRAKWKAQRDVRMKQLFRDQYLGVPGAGHRFRQHRLGMKRARVWAALGYANLKKANEVMKRIREERKRQAAVERQMGEMR